LINGWIVAYGTFVRNGTFGPIHCRQWARQNLLLDVKSGDLLEAIDGRAVVQWTGIMLQAPLLQPDSPGAVVDAEVFRANTTEQGGARFCAGESGARPDRKLTPTQASIKKAIGVLWPNGIPAELPLQVRDQIIIDWQKEQRIAVASSKTIRRFLARK